MHSPLLKACTQANSAAQRIAAAATRSMHHCVLFRDLRIFFSKSCLEETMKSIHQEPSKHFARP